MHPNREAEKKNMIVVHLIIFIFSVYMISASIPQFRLTDQSVVHYEVTAGIVEKHDLAISRGHGV